MPPRPSDLLLDGLVTMFTVGHEAGAPALRLALQAFRDEPDDGRSADGQGNRWLWLAARNAVGLLEDELVHGKVSGPAAFKLHDTFGFPIEEADIETLLGLGRNAEAVAETVRVSVAGRGEPYLLRISWPVLFQEPSPPAPLRVRAGSLGVDPMARLDLAAVRVAADDLEGAEVPCDVYCDLVMVACTEEFQVYEDRAQCMSVCAVLPPGGAGDETGNTVACRRYHSYNSMAAPSAHCAHAGPDGDGHCGTENCTAYCLIAEAACPGQFSEEFPATGDAGSQGSCMEECMELEGAAVDTSTYSLNPPASGNNVGCRTLHAMRALDDDRVVGAAELRTGAEDLVSRQHVRIGHAPRRILEFADEGRVDLIVLGSHGRTGLGRLLIGSVAERVVRKASCPVLTVRPEGHQFVMP
mgnify:CR=1 FL=1